MSQINRTTTAFALLACSTLLSMIFWGCADKIKSNLIAFKALDEGLTNSNIAINNSNETILASLEDKAMDPRTAEKAQIWYPKAKLIQKQSKDICDYIEGLRSDLKKEAGLKVDEGKESFREGDKNAVMRLFVKQEKGAELYKHLKKYKQDILAVDPDLLNTFKDILITTSSVVALENEQDFTKTYFDDLPTVAALALLSRFQNNVRIIENRMSTFCHNKTAMVILDPGKKNTD